MAITERTRKILWGRSGNRCAICKLELVVESTPHDDESVVGDECHIVSSSPGGPRYDPMYPKERLDAYPNLILLCGTHHKQIDDQVAKFSADVLRQMKLKHERWVSERLAHEGHSQPIHVRRIKENKPLFLSRLTTGQELLNLVSNAMAYSTAYDEPKSQEEADLVTEFLQTAQDWGDLSADMETGDQVRAAYNLAALLRRLEDNGLWAFGAREVQLLEGGGQLPSEWPVAILQVVRSNNDTIIGVPKSKAP